LRRVGGRAELSLETEELDRGRSSALRTAHPGLVRDVREEHRAFSVSVSPFGLRGGSRQGRGRLESFRALSSERPKLRREGKRLIAPSGARFLPSGRWEGREEGEEESVRR
jgi:hypothetical protein